MDHINFIIDLQYGSTGKGLFAGYLALQSSPDTIATAWGPNAGHTFMGTDGSRMVNIALPNGIVARSVKQVLLGPGSVINPARLREEMQMYVDLMRPIKLLIHPYAAIVLPRHVDAEKEYAFKIGSTMKGVGAAMCDKIRRDPDMQNTALALAQRGELDELVARCVVTVDEYNDALERARSVQVEGAQGFSLSLNHGFYPYCTSRDCTVQQLMVDCGLPLSAITETECVVNGVARTYPIRVANRFDPAGRQIGTSGPHYSDQRELDWRKDLGMEPELTTVTKLPRRIFSFSWEQVTRACKMNDVDFVFLNFCNYINGDIDARLEEFGSRFDEIGSPVLWTGWGPRVDHIKEGW